MQTIFSEAQHATTSDEVHFGLGL